MPSTKKSRKRVLPARTQLLWPRPGETVLGCVHVAETDNVRVFAMPRRPKFRTPDGSTGRAGYFVLCAPCADMAGASKTPPEKMAGRVYTWSPPPPVVVDPPDHRTTDHEVGGNHSSIGGNDSVGLPPVVDEFRQ